MTLAGIGTENLHQLSSGHFFGLVQRDERDILWSSGLGLHRRHSLGLVKCEGGHAKITHLIGEGALNRVKVMSTDRNKSSATAKVLMKLFLQIQKAKE